MVDTIRFLPDDILTKVDRASMAVSLETRVPMLDHEFAEFVWSLPANLRTDTKPPKQILFELACQHVPRKLIDRPKQGFGIPVANWLRGGLREWGESLLGDSAPNPEGLLDMNRIQSVWAQFLKGDDSLAEYLWSPLMFQAWYQHNLV